MPVLCGSETLRMIFSPEHSGCDVLNLILRLRWLIGLFFVAVGAGAWALDFTGLVYECPFCRTQRTVILILGVMLLLPFHGHWLVRYLSALFGFFGAAIGSMQHFGGWAAISGGEFELYDPWYLDPFLLSGCALCMITAGVLLCWAPRMKAVSTPS